jgi:2-dehydropantoate 2-reductase
VRIAVLGPGGVGGFLAGALARAGEEVTVVAREETAAAIARDGLEVESVRLGRFEVEVRAVPVLDEVADVLVVATKAPGLEAALGRIRTPPLLVVPLLNGFEHLAWLRARLGERRVAAGSIRIGAERVAPGRIVHTSPFSRVELAPAWPAVEALCHVLRAAEVPATVLDSEAEVLWSKLVRLCPLALTTAASGLTIGQVLAHPRWRLRLTEAIDETAAVAGAEGAPADPGAVLEELVAIPPGQRSSLARDVDAGGPNELDAIGGAVLRAAARHGLRAPAVEGLVQAAAERVR